MKNLSENDIILSIFQSNSPELLTTLSADQWRALYALSVEQGVLAMVWDKIQCDDQAKAILASIPRDLKIKWALNVDRIEEKYARQKGVIEKLARFFAEHGIKIMIIKGYGLSLNFPVPHHRPCGDIDLWFFRESHSSDGHVVRTVVQAEADELLRKHLNIRIDEDEHHHTVSYVDGVMLENHYDFINIHAHRSNRVIEQHLQEFVKGELETVDVNGATIYLPSPDFHALFLLRHSAAHFAAEKIGIRHLLDWSYFVEKYSSKIDWVLLEKIATEMNMHRFLHAMNAICVDYLSLDSKYLPAFSRDPKLEKRVLNEILHPEFDEEFPQGAGLVRSLCFKFRRWWANRWKHNIVYCEGLFETFFVQLWSHLLKPKTLTK